MRLFPLRPSGSAASAFLQINLIYAVFLLLFKYVQWFQSNGNNIKTDMETKLGQIAITETFLKTTLDFLPTKLL